MRTADPDRSRRALLRASAALPLAGAAGLALPRAARAAPRRGHQRVVVDLDRLEGPAPADGIGIGCSTYGSTPLDSAAQAAAELRLDARAVRIPVGIRHGRITSSARGSTTELDAVALVRWYRSHGWRVMVVLGGRTTDVDIGPGDAGTIIRALGTTGIDYTTPNEPTVSGSTIERQIATARMLVAEGRAVDPAFRIWGPSWAFPGRIPIRLFAQALGPGAIAGIDYHHYAMGQSSVETSTSLSQTAGYGVMVDRVRADMRAVGVPDRVDVSELHYTWRYQDGTAPSGRNDRLFTAVAPVWCATVIGEVLQAGGRAMVYATQNGALSILADGRVAGRRPSTPMPVHWGIAAWTGAGAFPHVSGRFVHTSATDPVTPVFAVQNEAGGVNVLLLNHMRQQRRSVNLRLLNSRPRVAQVLQTDPAAPYGGFRRLRRGSAPVRTVPLVLPPLSITVVVLGAR